MESEASAPITKVDDNEEIKIQEVEGISPTTSLGSEVVPLEIDHVSTNEDSAKVSSNPDTTLDAANSNEEPQIKDTTVSLENPTIKIEISSVTTEVEKSIRKDSSEERSRKDSGDVEHQKDVNEVHIRKDSRELPTHRDSQEEPVRKNSSQEEPRKNSSEVQPRKESKEIQPRKESNEVQPREESNEVQPPKDSVEVQPRRDSNETQIRKDSNESVIAGNVDEKTAPKDSKEAPIRKNSNDESMRKDSEENSSIAIVPDAPEIDINGKESNMNNDGESGEETKKLKSSADVEEELQRMIEELAEPLAQTSEKEKIQHIGKETTENLISVLEDGIDQGKEKPGNELKPEPCTATTSETPAIKPPKPKKYLYKLKSKTGKILHYTSSIPITLKRPVIHLTKMEDPRFETTPKVINVDKEEVDSDNSSKENHLKENEAPNDNVMPMARKKGRPPLSSRPPPPVITLDGNSSDTQDSFKSKSTPSFSMQTRKRQLKFLPDGRILPPQKMTKTSSSSDSDIDIISSEGEQTDKPSISSISRVDLANKKFKPDIKPMILSSGGDKRKYKKVFDFESYYREKTGVPPPANVLRSQASKTFTSSLTPIRKLVDTPRPKLISPAPSPAAPKKTSSVDAAQLLSSLIGVPISANQLNVVKFKPKIIQERTNNVITSTPKKVTFEYDKKKEFASNQSELLKSTPFKIVSKPTYQKILPKPVGMDKSSVMASRMTYQPLAIDNKFTPTVQSTGLFVAATSPFLRESLNETLSKFDTFTDSKVVKTKEGPRKALKRKHTDEEGALKDSVPKTIYDLMYDIFDKMPSWNLHLISNDNCFCIAQVSRGRMGIPTLKKSIELNSEFFAKVYVHQLHCKRYDGIYDTESKIIKLIKEIDALAA